MSRAERLPETLLGRKAVVYVRQSSPTQVEDNLESQRRQYALSDVARAHGFRDVEIIDDDLGRSASGTASRPGFERLVAQLCTGEIGAVLCLEASRLARNGRDWHRLLELCGLVEARVIDADGIYDPCRPNDRLLLGMKGTISEFELGVLRARMTEAARAKARRGELRIAVPLGFVWARDSGLAFDPDRRVQEVVRTVFERFGQLGSARQVFLWMHRQGLHFPRPSDGHSMATVEWRVVRYRNVIALLKNPFYAGAYAYGKSEKRVTVVEGRARTSYKHAKPIERWDVLIKDHHRGYIDWEEYERNQRQLAHNAYGKAGGVKSARGGRALLGGLLCCARCGRRLKVVYTGRDSAPKYRCDKPDHAPDARRCMAFSGTRVDEAIGGEIRRALQPLAIEATLEAERMRHEQQSEARRLLELELEQARYEAALAERRYAACDPDNRLIAAELERSWESALGRVRACEARLISPSPPIPTAGPADHFEQLADTFDAAWQTSDNTLETRQRLARALIEDIVVDVDEAAGEIVLIVHWKGGQHSEVRTHKPRSGEHGRRSPEEAIAVVRSMAGRWSDEHIAASLNRMGLRTGQGNTWTSSRVQTLRTTHGISAYRSAEKEGQWLTMSEAARRLGVSDQRIRRLIRIGVLPAEQVMARAPYQIRLADLECDEVKAALDRRSRPYPAAPDQQASLFSDT